VVSDILPTLAPETPRSLDVAPAAGSIEGDSPAFGPDILKEIGMKFIVKPVTKKGKRITLCIKCSEDPRFCW